MMSKKVFSRASRVCGVSFVALACAGVVVLACLVSGCDRDRRESAPQPAPPSPKPALSSAHMRDPALKRQLLDQRAERAVLERARQTIVEKMEDLVKTKYRGDMKAAANDPEMVSLIRRARDIETNLSSNRTHAAEMIRASAQKRATTSKKEGK